MATQKLKEVALVDKDENTAKFNQRIRNAFLESFGGATPKADNESGIVRRIVELDGDNYHIKGQILSQNKKGDTNINIISYAKVES